MSKSAVFGVMHVAIAFSIGWALTGSVAIAGAIALVEPVANMVAHDFFDRWWARRHERQRTGQSGDPAGAVRSVRLAAAGSHPRP